MNPRTKQVQWLVIVAGYWLLQLLYLVWPMDVLPDPMPLFGQVDDAAGMGSALLLTLFAIVTRKFGRKSGPKKALPDP